MYQVVANLDMITLGVNALGVIIAGISAYFTYLGVAIARRCFRKGSGEDACS